MLKISKDLFDLLYPIGIYVETSNANWSPSNAGWNGTWTREDDGTALVSYKSSGAFNKTIGTTTGEETHKLITNEMPSHEHNLWLSNYGNGSIYPEGNGSSKTGTGLWALTSEPNNYPLKAMPIGGNQSHNNIQPSKVIYRWHRTA